MTRRRNLNKRTSPDDSTLATENNISEDDVDKILKKHKLEVNNNKCQISSLLKNVLESLDKIFKDLIKDSELESYDIFGGYRYGYLLKNDINVDLLLKIYKNEGFLKILDKIKGSLGLLLPGDNKLCKDMTIKLYLCNDNEISYNLCNNVLVLSFYNKIRSSNSFKEGYRNKGENGKDSYREVEIFRFKLFFLVVKYSNGKRKVNMSEYIIEKLDEYNKKYFNACNTIVLVKILLHNYNLTHLPVKDEFNFENESKRDFRIKRFIGTGFNGHMFNLVALNLCILNNYSNDIKTSVLFKNLLYYMLNFLKKGLNDLKKGDGIESFGSRESDGLFGDISARYPSSNLFKAVEITIPQMTYFLDIFLKILGSGLSREEKVSSLFLRRNKMSNFYENYLTFKTDSEDKFGKSKEVLTQINYGLGERLSLFHYYLISRHYLIDSFGSNTPQNLDNCPSCGHGDFAMEWMRRCESRHNYNFIIYFTFNSNIQSMVIKGPVHNTQSESERSESERFKKFWNGHWELVKYNNLIQHVVNLDKLISLNESKELSNHQVGKKFKHLFDKSKGKRCNKSDRIEQLLLTGDESVNVTILRYILEKVLDLKSLVTYVSNFNEKYPSVTDYHKKVVTSANTFSDILRGLEDIPLKILNVHVYSESYSYCNVYSAFADTQLGDGRVPLNGPDNCGDDDGIVCLIKLESNSKWPIEDHKAMTYIRFSLLLTIQRELRVKYDIQSVLYSECLSVNHEGLLYKLILITPEVVGLKTLELSERGAGPAVDTLKLDGMGNSKNLEVGDEELDSEDDFKVDSSENYMKHYELGEKCRNAVMTDVGFINCVRLTKIFFSRHLRMDFNEFVKLMCLSIYDTENSIKSDSSGVCFNQLMYYLSLEGLGSEESHSKPFDSAFGKLTEKQGIGSDDKKLMSKFSKMFINHINNNLTTLPLEDLTPEHFGFDCTEQSQSSLQSSHKSNWSKNSKIDGNNENIPNSQNTIRNKIKIKSNDLEFNELVNERNHNILIKLNNLYNQSRVKEGIYRTQTHTRTLIRYLIKYLTKYLSGFGSLYYYKYEIFNHFDTRNMSQLSLYIKFNKLKFVPRIHLKPQNYPQSIIVSSYHTDHIKNLKLNNLEKRNNLVQGDGSNYEGDNLILVPNISLILKVITKLTSNDLLNNIIIL